MNYFLQKHKKLGCLLDWIVLLTSPIIILLIIGEIKDLSTSPKLPVFLNMFSLAMFAYVNFKETNSKLKFKTLKDWANPIFYINIIALASQLTFGGYTRNYRKVVEPLWKIDKMQAIKIISIYLIFIALSGICMLIPRKKVK